MPRSKINFDTVRKIGLALPGVEESTAYGSPALKVHGKLLACVPAHRLAEPNSLMVRVGFDDRAELLEAAPDVYYVTETMSATAGFWFACPASHLIGIFPKSGHTSGPTCLLENCASNADSQPPVLPP